MTKLVWDSLAERTYETGLARGVLYQPVSPGVYDNGVVWNGLTGVEEQFTDDLTEVHYFDGVKYLDSYQIGDFSAVLKAYTYPEEFLTFEGIEPLGPGFYVDTQASEMFGMSYQTAIGSGTEGDEAGYLIHLLYNLTVVEDVYNYQNGSNLPSVIEFRWTVHSVPEHSSPYRPTSHIILDSRYLDAPLLAVLEDTLYGTNVATPRLPSLDDLIDFIVAWDPRFIVATPSTGLSPLTNAAGDLTPTSVDGVYSALPDTRLTETDKDGLNVIVP